MLTHLHKEYNLRNADDIDSLICAQIPVENQDVELYNIIKSYYPWPCVQVNNASLCMKEGQCAKHFPMQFNDGTVIDGDRRSMYHRPDNGRTVRIWMLIT